MNIWVCLWSCLIREELPKLAIFDLNYAYTLFSVGIHSSKLERSKSIRATFSHYESSHHQVKDYDTVGILSVNYMVLGDEQSEIFGVYYFQRGE